MSTPTLGSGSGNAASRHLRRGRGVTVFAQIVDAMVPQSFLRTSEQTERP